MATRSKKRPRDSKGIVTRPDGTHQVHYMVKGVRTWSPRFPADTPRSTLLKWREDALTAAQTRPSAAIARAPAAGRFTAAIADYGQRRAALASISRQLVTLHRWAAVLGRDRDPDGIQPHEIERQLQQWQLAGMAQATARKVAVYLQGFYTLRNGKGGINPARVAHKPATPKYDQPRAIPYPVILQILDHLAPRRFARGGPVPALAPARLRVIAFTGIPPGVLATLRRVHLRDLDRGVVHLPPRRKGSGVEARTIALTAQGVAAFRAFIAAGAWGPFRDAPLNKTFKSAARKVGLVDEQGRATVHCYDLRHSFGTLMYETTRDLDTVGRLLGHAKGSRLTARYALGANQNVDVAAVAAVSERLAATLAAHTRSQSAVA